MSAMNKKIFAMAALCMAAALWAGCGDADTAPNAPGNPAAGENRPPAAEHPEPADKASGLTVHPPAAIVAPGSELPLTLASAQRSGKDKPLSPAKDGVRFSSSDPEIASVDDKGKIHIGAKAKTGDRAEITVNYKEFSQTVRLEVRASLEDTIETNSQGIAVVTNPLEPTVVVNKERNLPEGFKPPDLVEPDIPFSFNEKHEKRLMQRVAAEALEELFAQAEQDNIELYGISAYRSYSTQKSLFDYYVRTQGEAEARQYSAMPGQSEHQTGLAMDVSSRSANFALEELFADTPEGRWLAENCAEFGFIIRYPKGKEEITGYNYEPWHIRYVGKEIAREIHRQGITLEEYFAQPLPVFNPQ